MISISALVIILVGNLVAAQERTCSTFCSSLGMLESNPGKSCDDIYQINRATRGVSGDYWIQTATGTHEVYCDMELECGGHKGGWMRVANFSTGSGDDCPIGWTKITTPADPVHPSIEVCRSSNDTAGCYPTVFSVFEASYHKICGMARGYQKGGSDGFANNIVSMQKGISTAYADGLSITIGNPRQHVWTYAVGLGEEESAFTGGNCPCAGNEGTAPHPFIGNHYYCESGSAGEIELDTIFTNDPLWDGDGCVDANNNCCTSPGMPWFLRKFPVGQQEDIEVRICTDQEFSDEGLLVDQLQLYVQ